MDYETIEYRIEERIVEAYWKDGGVWIPQRGLAELYGRGTSAITKAIVSIQKTFENSLTGIQQESAISKTETTELVAPDGKRYKTYIYGESAILEMDRHFKTSKGEKLIEWAHEKYESRYEIVRFNQDNIEIDVHVAPEEATVWLTQLEIARLFQTTRKNVSQHILNILSSEEQKREATVKEIWTVQNEGGRSLTRKLTYYNLAMITAIGFRVNSKRGTTFRIWANSLIQNYLLKGYAIDKKRVAVTEENIKELHHQVDSITYRVEKLEKKAEEGSFAEHAVFQDGQRFEAYEFFCRLFSKAEHSIILIDPYADENALSALSHKKEGVEVRLLYGKKARLTKEGVNLFNKEYGGLTALEDDSFHDRYIILDEKESYHLGASLNHAGSKFTEVIRHRDDFVRDLILSKVIEGSTTK